MISELFFWLVAVHWFYVQKAGKEGSKKRSFSKTTHSLELQVQFMGKC